VKASRRAFVIVSLAQMLLVLGFAGVRQAAVSLGTKVVLQTVPVDPRDLFRGDYVVLSYEISTLDFCEARSGEKGYVPLREEPDGVWQAPLATAFSSYESASGLGDVVISGTVSGGNGFGSCRMTYGIESYFVPEDTGHRIEQLAGELDVRVSVDGDGDAVIDELIFPEDD
jgi:uncharacterized membrane-anchored protein